MCIIGIPTLKRAFYFYSLTTGVTLICGISLLWNVGWYLFGESKSPPFVLEILDSQNFIQLPGGHHFVEYRRCYYIIQIVVLISSLFGGCKTRMEYKSKTKQNESSPFGRNESISIQQNQLECGCNVKPCCLFLLIVIEQLMIYIYAFATVRYGYMWYMRFSEGKSIFTTDTLHEILFPILFVLHFYLCSIIISFLIDSGRVATTPSIPEAALSQNDHTSPNLSTHGIIRLVSSNHDPNR